jgi:hypothetical protein
LLLSKHTIHPPCLNPGHGSVGQCEAGGLVFKHSLCEIDIDARSTWQETGCVCGQGDMPHMIKPREKNIDVLN